MENYAQTNGGRLLQRGNRFDPECSRTTHRLRVGQKILSDLGLYVERKHSDRMGLVGTGLMQHEGHVCDDRCKAIWPEHITGETFVMAYRLAEVSITDNA